MGPGPPPLILTSLSMPLCFKISIMYILLLFLTLFQLVFMMFLYWTIFIRFVKKNSYASYILPLRDISDRFCLI